MMTSTKLQVKEVQFNGDTLLATQDNNGNVYAGVSYICNGIGLSKSQKDTQIQNVQSDIVLKRGCLKFQAGVLDPNNTTVALLIDFLPLWLAKISITPKMQENNPKLVEKLIAYQLKAKDVLAKAFLPQHQTNQLTTSHPLLEQSVYHLQQSQQNIINLSQKHDTQLYEHEYRISNIEDQLKLNVEDQEDNQTTAITPASEITYLPDMKSVYQDIKDNGYDRFACCQTIKSTEGTLVTKRLMFFKIIDIKKKYLEFKANDNFRDYLNIHNIERAEKIVRKGNIADYKIYCRGSYEPVVIQSCKWNPFGC